MKIPTMPCSPAAIMLKAKTNMKSILDSRSERSGKPRKRFVFWLSIVLAALFLYLALRGLDWTAFISALRKANYGLIPVLFVWSSIGSWVRAVRWQTLLNAGKYIPAQNVFWANMAGYLGNNIFPARAGEFIRAAYVSKENKLSMSYSLATGFVERMIDLIALVILGSISLSIAGLFSPPIQDALGVMAGVAIVGIAALLVTLYFGGGLRRILADRLVVSTSVREKIGKVLEQFLSGVEVLRHPKRAAVFILFTCLIWLMDGVGIVILARALHLQFTLPESLLLLAALGLSSAIPSTPGYIGVYQFVAVIVLQPFGITNTSAVAFILCLQAVNLLIVAFWGGISIWRTSSVQEPTS
jgi:uncharacterized protein (TIRG00374 family)